MNFQILVLLATFSSVFAQVTHPWPPREDQVVGYGTARSWVKKHDTVFEVVILEEKVKPCPKRGNDIRHLKAIISHVYKGNLQVGSSLTFTEPIADHTSLEKHRMRLCFINKNLITTTKDSYSIPHSSLSYFFRDKMNTFEKDWYQGVVYYTSWKVLRAIEKEKAERRTPEGK